VLESGHSIIILSLDAIYNLLRLLPLPDIRLYSRPHPFARCHSFSLTGLSVPESFHDWTLDRPQLELILWPNKIQHPRCA